MQSPAVHTPVDGMLLRRTEDGIPVLRIHYSADPDTRSEEWKAEQRKRYTSDVWWNLEMEIEYEALSGQRIYPEFDPVVHVIPDDKIPRTGSRYMSIDPHPRTPHAALWLLIDRWHDWYIYRDLWPSVHYGKPEMPTDEVQDHRWTTRDYAEAIAKLEGNHIDWRNAETDKEYGLYRSDGGERIIMRLMDQAGKGFMATGETEESESFSDRYARYGIRCADPIKSHQTGEDAVHELLKIRHHEFYGEWPRLHIAASCKETILELVKHRYKKTPAWNEERELKQVGVDARCHMIDNLRYLATGRLTHIPSLAS